MLEGFILALGMFLHPPPEPGPGSCTTPSSPPAFVGGILASLAVGRAEPRPTSPETSTRSISPPQLCQQQIYLGFFFFPVLERFRKKKITFQRHHLCSRSVPVKIKRLGLISSFLRQKINKCNQRTCQGERNFRSKDRSSLLQAKKTRQKEIFLFLNVFFLSFFSWSVWAFQPRAMRRSRDKSEGLGGNSWDATRRSLPKQPRRRFPRQRLCHRPVLPISLTLRDVCCEAESTELGALLKSLTRAGDLARAGSASSPRAQPGTAGATPRWSLLAPGPSPPPGSVRSGSFGLLTPPDLFCPSLFGSARPLGFECHRGEQYPAINPECRGVLSKQLGPRMGQASLPPSPLPALEFWGVLLLWGGFPPLPLLIYVAAFAEPDPEKPECSAGPCRRLGWAD